MIRTTLYYAGRVQGVGFRATTCAVAEGFAVTGHVRNLPDGRVQLVAEGERRELDAFLAAVDDRLGHHIHRRTRQDTDATHEFDTFTIRY